MLSKEARKFESLYSRIGGDIFAFCRALNFEPTQQQHELLEAIMLARLGKASRFIAVKSGQGPGKTTASAVGMLWLSFESPYSKIVTTAPTMRQCRDVWLAELKRVLREADPSIARWVNVTGTGYSICGNRPSDWGCVLVTATTPESAQGQHNKNMHILFEEASGISRPLYEQYKGTASNPGAVFLQIGNPNTRDSPFFDCFNSQRHVWNCFTWNAEETPKSVWFDPIRNKELEEEFGRDSDVYRIRVLGQFPHADPNCVMSSEDLEKCMNPSLHLPMARLHLPDRQVRQFGIDYARFGGDETCIVRRQGSAVVERYWRARVDPNDATDLAFKMQYQAGWSDQQTLFVADAGGLGQGMMRHFHRAGKTVIEFHSQGASTQTDYANRITQAWFHLAQRVRQTRCYLPKDRILMQQLSSRQYYTNSKGKLILESKDDYMKRGFDSPDRADGTVMAFYDGAVTDASVASKAPASRRMGVR